MPDVWVPFANRRPVALRSSQRRITPVGLVCHTAVSNAKVLVPSGEVRWHFYVGKTGELHQFFPVNVSAACQLHGNYWLRDGKPAGFLSAESWDGAGTSAWPDFRTNHSGGPAWTPEQVDTFVRLGAWLHEEWDVFLGKATGPRGKGIGQHSDFTGRKDELRWNTTHACVGTRRKAQMSELRTRMAGAPSPTTEEDSVTPEDREEIARRAAELVWELRIKNPESQPGARAPFASEYLVGQGNEIDGIKDQLALLTKKVDLLLARDG